MKTLVTGATGFVGQWLVKKLISLGHDVHILYRNPKSLVDLEGLNITPIKSDITDQISVIEATKGIENIFHLAGVVGYKKSMRQNMVMVNVVGTANIIEACLINNIKRLVHFSSVAAIGASFKPEPLNESSEFNISNLDLGYFETKREAERLVIEAVQEKNLNAVIVNPSTIYGPGDMKKGSRKFQMRVAQGKFPFYTSGGVNVIHIEDVINATIKAWEIGRTGERYILAGENLLIKDLFTIIAEASGVTAPKILLPSFLLHTVGAIGDVLEKNNFKGPLSSENAWTSTLYHWFDSTKAQNELGLKPKPARKAIEESINWAKQNGYI